MSKFNLILAVVTLNICPGLSFTVNLTGKDVVRRNDSIHLNCSSDGIPVGFTADLLVNDKSYTSIRLYKNKCYSSIEGSECGPAVCQCSKSGKWFSYTYKALHPEGIVRITCLMTFLSRGSSSDSLDINIYDFTVPRISTNTEFPLSAGLVVQFTCTAESQAHYISLEWDCLSGHTVVNEVFNSSQYVSVFEKIVRLSSENEICKCNAKVEKLSMSTSVRLKISPTPILSLDKNKECYDGHFVVLTCTVLNDLPAFGFYPWTHILDGKYIRELEGKHYGNISTLTFKSCNYQDVGIYSCRAWSEYLNSIHIVTNEVGLQINGPPVFHSSQINKMTLIARIYSLHFISTPRWYFEGNLIENSTEFVQNVNVTKIDMEFYGHRVECSGYETSLSAETIKAGKFSVIVENAYGKVKKSFISQPERDSSFDIRSLIMTIAGIGIFIVTMSVTVILLKGRRRTSIVQVVTSTEISLATPVYYSAPQQHEGEHVYERTSPNYMELFAYQSEHAYSDTDNKNGPEVLAGTTDPRDNPSEYEEID